MSETTVSCRDCGRVAKCATMSDGTMYRPFTWQYPDPANTLSGLCPDCQGVGFELKLTPLVGIPQHDFEVMITNEVTRRRDEELAELIEQSRQRGPMTSEEQREQRISWVYGNCKLSNPEVTREMVENAVDFGASTAMTIRPVSAYADNEPELDPPTEEDLAARRKWADRHVAVITIPIAVSPSAPSAVPTYNNPLAALRRERKVKSGKAAKLLGISRQRLHVVEHATKALLRMDRLLAKAAIVWPVGDETAVVTVAKGGDDARK